MFLLVLFVYISLAIAINDDILVKSPANQAMDEEWTKEYYRTLLKKRENFTNCEEFLENARFDITRVLNVAWQVFYIWRDINEIKRDVSNFILNFQLPNTMMIQRFQANLGQEFKNINWTAAQLYVESSIESGIFLATNKSGLFDTISYITPELDPILTQAESNQIALKFVEPHYLGVMHCKSRELTALAPVGQLPSEQQMESVAKLFKFKSSYGISSFELNKKINQDVNRQRVFSEEDDRDLSMNVYEPNDNHLSVL